MTELAHFLCGMVPAWDVSWSDGSGAARYGPYVALFDSRSNVSIYEVSADDDAMIRADLENNDAESWLLFNDGRWSPVIDEPEDTPEDQPDAYWEVTQALENRYYGT